MKNIILYILIPFTGLSQYTNIPDPNFELVLLNYGYDLVIDGVVETSAIDTLTELQLNDYNISDLSGIEDFISLQTLYCQNNNITNLNLSNNSNLFEVICANNNLQSIDLRNGNNTGLWYFMSMNNPMLNCIDVDDITWCEYNFAVDTWTAFSNNCNPSSINQIEKVKKLIKITDINGKNCKAIPNTTLLYFYSDGSVVKRIYIE